MKPDLVLELDKRVPGQMRSIPKGTRPEEMLRAVPSKGFHRDLIRMIRRLYTIIASCVTSCSALDCRFRLTFVRQIYG